MAMPEAASEAVRSVGEKAEAPKKAGKTKKKADAKQHVPTAKEKRDNSIMETNNSCITSKRCVEKLYFKQEPGFLRYFVKRFQRRSPLISRGYYLRCKAIEHTVTTFLRSSAGGRPKTVVNLGCGYDTLPFKLLSSQAELCIGARFVDVDYLDLMKRKTQVLANESVFRDILPDLRESASPEVLLDSSQYIAIGCDLHDSEKLAAAFEAIRFYRASDVLFIAEVSITYMEDAQSIIKWTSQFPRAQFCLLEQYLPDGPDHPFATTMLRHFEKLNSPLRSACERPSADNQMQRFRDCGWLNVSLRSLWDIWQDEDFLTSYERQELDAVEPFDEWEEYVLFASHYFVLHASQLQLERPEQTQTESMLDSTPSIESETRLPGDLKILRLERTTHAPLRRYAGACSPSTDIVVIHGGHGANNRLSSQDVFFRESDNHQQTDDLPYTHGPPSKGPETMCHTLTALSSSVILIGGRSSPSSASNKCFILPSRSPNPNPNTWKPLCSLPTGLYRHCTVAVPKSSEHCEGILVFGGKVDHLTISTEVYYLEPDGGKGWQTVELSGDHMTPRFGASMCTSSIILSNDAPRNDIRASGLLTGGLDQHGRILCDMYHWDFTLHNSTPRLHLTEQTSHIRLPKSLSTKNIGRFGATLVARDNDILLIGGVCSTGVIPHHEEILSITADLSISPCKVQHTSPRPLLVGHSAIPVSENQILILGGGAVCFSFGTCWNTSNYLLGTDIDASLDRFVSPSPQPPQPPSLPTNPGQHSKSITTHTLTPTSFQTILSTSEPEPVIFPSLDLGPCLTLWPSPSYLKSLIPSSHMVTVHDSPLTKTMSFASKNFTYRRMSFHKLLDATARGAPLYMRSISSSPTTTPTTLSADWPSIAPDFTLPESLSFVSANIHSSPLRISGAVRMWLHYDVMANVLCQITGPPRRVLLFHPSEAIELGFEAGKSTSPRNPFDDPAVRARAREATLYPGDVLFIPPCWPHAACPEQVAAPDITATTEDQDSIATSTAEKSPHPNPPEMNERQTSISVNVFFRSLPASAYATGRDVYGNRDIAAYERGRREVEHIKRAFAEIPPQTRGFYLRRLAVEMLEGCENTEGKR